MESGRAASSWGRTAAVTQIITDYNQNMQKSIAERTTCWTLREIGPQQHLWGMFPAPCWIHHTKYQGSLEGKRGLMYKALCGVKQHIYLITCPVSGCHVWRSELVAVAKWRKSSFQVLCFLLFSSTCNFLSPLIWLCTDNIYRGEGLNMFSPINTWEHMLAQCRRSRAVYRIWTAVNVS